MRSGGTRDYRSGHEGLQIESGEIFAKNSVVPADRARPVRRPGGPPPQNPPPKMASERPVDDAEGRGDTIFLIPRGKVPPKMAFSVHIVDSPVHYSRPDRRAG